MTGIIGTYECKVDDKGRLMLPAGIRKQLLPMLQDGFVLKRSVFSPCLELFPMKEWERQMATVNGLNRFKKRNVDFIRIYTAGVKVIELDSTGRLLVPRDLADFSGITHNVVLSSAVSHIEMWDKERYEQTINDPNVDFAKLAEEVMGNLNDRPDDDLS